MKGHTRGRSNTRATKGAQRQRVRTAGGLPRERVEVKKCGPWKLKPGFINRVLVAVIFEASKCLLEIVFLEPQNWRPLKPHY